MGKANQPMNFFTDGLTPSQMEILKQLAPVPALYSFRLGGGTALAIHLGHRRSIDLDWFTLERFNDPMRFAQELRDEDIRFTTSQTAPGTLHGDIDGVRISFLEFRYPLLKPVLHWPETGIYLLSLDDLACMKLSAIAQRSAKKDFYDVHALCNLHLSLEQMLGLYQEKFSVQDISPVLYGLVYFDDAEEEPDPILLEKKEWEQVKRDFRKWVKDID